jgi:TonB-dependent SusC/RagA subfamily outer membrane receptor
MENHLHFLQTLLPQRATMSIVASVGTLVLLYAPQPAEADENAEPGPQPAIVQETQQTRVKGSVTDKDGAIIGASLKIKGTGSGTTTDTNGNFTLSGVKAGDVIVVSYVGYVTKQLRYNGQNFLRITLTEDAKQLNEVVVVGYGTQKRLNLTGAVSTVDSKTIVSRPVQNVGQALEGVVPGLNFSVSYSGTGGTLDSELSFNIRGTGTIGTGSSGAPLVLIDGVEGNFNKMNPADIENISVLKDAAACAIYGSRASFGVILITTKSGKAGKTRVEYNGSMRFTDALQIPDMMDSYKFALYFNRAAENGGQECHFQRRNASAHTGLPGRHPQGRDLRQYEQ